VRVEPVEGEEQGAGLESFLLDWPAAPYRPPWLRLFVQMSKLVPWHAGAECPECAGAVTFAMVFPFDPNRLGDPSEVALCLGCGSIEISTCVTPRRNRVRMSASAWTEPAVAILALKHAVRDRLAAQEASDWSD
jgi:hypothetical protein